MILSWKTAETERELRACFRLRALEYGRLYTNAIDGELRDELDDERLPGGERRACSVLTTDPDGAAVGTARLAIARDPRYPELRPEAGALMDFDFDRLLGEDGPPGGRGGPVDKVCEVGRLAIARGTDIRAALRSTLEGIGRVAIDRDVAVLIAVMAPFVEARVRALGIHFRRVIGARLHRHRREELRYLLTYHEYFLPAFRKRGLEVDPEQLARAASLDTIQALVSDCGDGPHLYAIPTDDFLRPLRV